MLRVGLTGGIATGKSYVARHLAAAGVPVVDADLLARAAVAPGSAGLSAVRARFGEAVIAPDGGLDRSALADLVFGDDRARADLEAIVHPTVRAGINRFFDDLPPSIPFAVADIPLLFETGRATDFDAVIVAACPRTVQVQRVMARDRLSAAQAERRVAAQWPIERKVANADYVVDTSGPYAATDAAVDRVIADLRARARSSG
jgi:dephospho-CoA kinase